MLWDPRVRRLYDYWRGIHPPGGGLPGRQHVDPLDLPDLLASLWLVDIDRQGLSPRFRYRLLGTRQVEAMQRDCTGLWMDAAHPTFLSDPYYHHYLTVAGGEPSWRRGVAGFHADKDYYELERIMLPLARDGITPDVILAITVYFDRGGKNID